MKKIENLDDVPELFTSDDGEDTFTTRGNIPEGVTLEDRWEANHMDENLVERYAFNCLTVTEKQSFEKKYLANKVVMMKLNNINRIIENEKLYDYQQYLEL